MNALDLLHKIRTCDKRGKFQYADTEVLNDLIEMIKIAEAGARQIAIEQAVRILAERAAGYAGREDTIYNGAIMRDELKANERRIRSIS